MRRVTADLSILPLGTKTTSLSPYLIKVKEMLSSQDAVDYKISGMSTELEGDIDEIWRLIRKIQEVLFEENLDRVYTVLKIDDRRDKKSTLKSKESSLNNAC